MPTPPALSPSIEADADYLLCSTDFMKAQYGMAVEAVDATDLAITIRTTGAEFAFDPATSLLRLRQRVGKSRNTGAVAFERGALKGLRVAGQDSGAVRLSAGGGRLQLRINADSLLMLKSQDPLTLATGLAFSPSIVREYLGNVLFLDEQGGAGFFPATGPAPATTLTGSTNLRQRLAPNQILWLSVAPPRPYQWDRSYRDRVVWHWSKETGYPSDAQIESWSQFGNVLLQQSEVMMWKDWSLRFIPRNGPEEFERVVRTCRRFGMQNIVYTSPFYFLTGTGLEDKAMNTFENFKGFSPGDGRGLNWPLFVEEIRRVMREYRPAGLYFDGIYNNVVRTYLLARKAREIVGDAGILEYHGTLNPGANQHTPPGGGLNLPALETWFDFVLRGEGQQAECAADEFLRYSISTYNISNSIGVLCDNSGFPLTDALLDRLLDCNVRLHAHAAWEDGQPEVLARAFWPHLNESLRARVEAASMKRMNDRRVSTEDTEHAET